MNRRQALQSLALVSLGAALAGCGSGGDSAHGTGSKSAGPSGTAGDTVAPGSGGVLVVNAARMTPGPAARAGADLTGFGVKILLKDARIGATANGSISPYSIYSALAMTDAGAIGASQTELAKLLGGDQQRQAGNITAIDAAVAKAISASKGAQDGPSVVEAANSLWPDKALAVRKDYLQALAAGYGAKMHVVDYQHDAAGAVRQINGWVGDRTHGLIPHLLEPSSVGPATRLELVNALYLKAAWTTAFEKPSAPRAFTTAAGSQAKVPYMTAEAPMPVASGSNWRSVTIPYTGGGLAMTIVLPKEGAFAQVRSSLATALTAATHGTTGGDVTLTMPPFSIDTRSQLVSTLEELGVRALFGPSADLSGIGGRPGEIHVNSVSHQSVVKVDQHGTEAAAATSVGMQAGAVQRDQPTRITVDRAFFFVIHDTTTGAPLFLGQIADPS